MTQHSGVADVQDSQRTKPSTGRLLGVDLARGLAVFGMYAAHVGPDPSQGGTTGFVMELTHGRSSALFAFLAGFSIVLITGRGTPKTGRAGRQALVKVAVRALILLTLGTALTMAEAPVDVILAFYGLYFLLVLPLYRLRARPLAVLAGGAALILPQVLYVVRQAIGDEDFGMPGEPDGIVALLFTGSYPALTWIPFVIAGMAVAHLDLAATTVRLRLALAGAALAVAGYGGSWLALHLVPGALAAISDSSWGEDATSVWWSDTAGYPTGETPAWLLAASPHSDTTLSILGNTGVAITVLSGCLAATAVPRLAALVRPVIAVGSMSLTAYVLHIIGIQLLDSEELIEPAYVLLEFIAAAMAFATLWSHFLQRGPLEWLMTKATSVARHVP
jgi:uncharacterized membrane protein YeiB